MKLAVRLFLFSLCLLTVSPALAGGGILGSQVFEGKTAERAPEAKTVKPKTVEPKKKAGAKTAGPKTDAEIRQWYIDRVATIAKRNAKWVADGLSAEARAHLAYGIRRDARIKARAMMASESAVRALRARDRVKYGNPNGPTFDYLVRKNRAKGLEGDAVFEAIVGSAQRTQRKVSKRHSVRSGG